jgi:hypothetical protein
MNVNKSGNYVMTRSKSSKVRQSILRPLDVGNEMQSILLFTKAFYYLCFKFSNFTSHKEEGTSFQLVKATKSKIFEYSIIISRNLHRAYLLQATKKNLQIINDHQPEPLPCASTSSYKNKNLRTNLQIERN